MKVVRTQNLKSTKDNLCVFQPENFELDSKRRKRKYCPFTLVKTKKTKMYKYKRERE